MAKALIILADRFEELSLYLPWYRLREEGVEVTLASPLMHALTGLHGHQVEPDARIHEVTPTDFDLLVIPHGPAAEILRVREEALDVARTLAQEGRVASIGHGAQVLLSAGALDGRTVTASPAIRDDIRAAGAVYRDEAVVHDDNLLTARSVDDMPEFCARLIQFLKQPAKA